MAFLQSGKSHLNLGRSSHGLMANSVGRRDSEHTLGWRLTAPRPAAEWRLEGDWSPGVGDSNGPARPWRAQRGAGAPEV